MDVKEIKRENWTIDLEFTVPYEEIKDEYAKEISELRKTITIPGFRKGKVPEKIFKLKAKEYLEEDLISKKTKEIIPDYLEKSEYNVSGMPIIKDEKFSEGEPLTFVLEIEIYPEIDLKKEDIQSFKTKAIKVKVTKEDIQNEIDELCKKDIKFIDKKDAAIELDDIVYINMVGIDKENNNEIQELNYKDFSFTLKEDVADEKEKNNAQLLLDIFNKNAKGKKAGDKIEVEYTYPEDVNSKILSGKTVLFKIDIVKVETKEKPEFTDEIAKKNGFESVADAKEKLKKQLEERKQEEAKNEMLEGIFGELIEKYPFELGPNLLKQSQEAELQKLSRNLSQLRIDLNKYFEIIKSTPEAWLETQKDVIIKTTKKELFLNEIVKLENIEVTKEEMDENLEKTAEQYKMKKAELKRQIISSGRWKNFKEDFKLEKAEDLLLSRLK